MFPDISLNKKQKIYNFVMMVFKHWDSLDTTMPETPEAVLEIPKDTTMPETAEAETPEAEAEIPKDVCRRWNRQLASHPKPVFDMVD